MSTTGTRGYTGLQSRVAHSQKLSSSLPAERIEDDQSAEGSGLLPTRMAQKKYKARPGFFEENKIPIVILLILLCILGFKLQGRAAAWAEKYKARYTTLNSRQELMQAGFGTWQSQKGEAGAAVKYALEHGQRHLDLADRYGNQAEIGEHALEPFFASGEVPRKDVFITTKLWGEDHRPKRAKPAVVRMLKDLRLQYVDLLLIHWPVAIIPGTGSQRDGGVTMLETWRALEALVAQGLVKAIGVSNFNVAQLTSLLKNAHLVPVVNQVEMHPYLPQAKMLAFCKNHNIAVVAYSPLGSPGNVAGGVIASKGAPPSLLEAKVVQRWARKLGKTPAQLLIKWSMQKGAIPIPKSVKPHRIAENFDVWSWYIPSMGMIQLESLKATPWRYVSGKKWLKPGQTLQEFWDDEY